MKGRQKKKQKKKTGTLWVKAGLKGLMKVERRGRGKGEEGGRGRNGSGRGEKTHLTPVASELPSQMAKQETGLSSEEADLLRAEILGSSCVQSSQCANTILFHVVGTWRSHTFQIKHKDKQSLNSSDPVPNQIFTIQTAQGPTESMNLSQAIFKGDLNYMRYLARLLHFDTNWG